MLSEAERQVLNSWVKRRTTAQGLALRARIVLACAEGGPNLAVAARLAVNRGTVAKWRSRFPAGPAGRPRGRAQARSAANHYRRPGGGRKPPAEPMPTPPPLPETRTFRAGEHSAEDVAAFAAELLELESR